nr:glycosyltransferase [Rhodospirillales bacterium]
MISIICPFYNEEDSIPVFFKELLSVLTSINEKFEILCINDGSSDQTLDKLLQQQILSTPQIHIQIIDFSRNFGKEAAITAGIDQAQGNALIPIDTDLQDPPELIKEMILKWREGYDIVLAKRNDRSSDGWIKKNTAKWFYKVHNAISSPPIPEDVGDYRLLDRQVAEALKKLPERQRFMKGIFNWVGFNSTTITFTRKPRTSGHTKFVFSSLWSLALEGITSFSTVPLKIWTYLGLIISSSAFCYASFIIIRTFYLGIDLPGYASLIVTILFLGGLQLIGIGVLGEYIGRIYLESKQRPVYIIQKKYLNQD